MATLQFQTEAHALRWVGLYHSSGAVGNARLTALIMSAAWQAAADWPDESLAQLLGMNSYPPRWIATGVPVPLRMMQA